MKKKKKEEVLWSFPVVHDSLDASLGFTRFSALDRLDLDRTWVAEVALLNILCFSSALQPMSTNTLCENL